MFIKNETMSNKAYFEYISNLESLFETTVKRDKDPLYEGERNTDGLPNGFGQLYYTDNDKNGRKIYVGEFKNGERHGKGKLIWADGSTYDGFWQDDVRHGVGIFTNADGHFYNGKWKSGKKHGKGVQNNEDGSSFEGEWFEDELIESTELQYAGHTVVKIGEQLWMRKNLDVDTFRNGDPIPHVSSFEEWKEYGEQGEPAWCFYDNRKANGEDYGKLYNWYAVNDPRGLAPEGWKIPNVQEWNELVEYCGGEQKAGGCLKSTHGWNENGNGTDKYGFAGVPGGCRSIYYDYYVGEYARMWSSSEFSSVSSWSLELFSFHDAYSSNAAIVKYNGKEDGFSVRCLSD